MGMRRMCMGMVGVHTHARCAHARAHALHAHICANAHAHTNAYAMRMYKHTYKCMFTLQVLRGPPSPPAEASDIGCRHAGLAAEVLTFLPACTRSRI